MSALNTYLYRKVILALVVSMPMTWAMGQGGLIIGSAAQVVVTGNPTIVITNGKWQNDGTFVPDLGQVKLDGATTTANSAIGGASATTFYDLTQAKSANDVLLSQNINVSNNFTMNGGLFELNNFNVTLGTASGQVVNETETNRITGLTGGQISKTMTLNAPSAINPGNLGAEITSAVNLGVTTILRGHVQQTDGNGGLSINRYFDISPTTNSSLNATLRQYYFDAELAGRVESELEHYNSLNSGLSWYDRSFSTRNLASNFVENSGYADFSTRWTLASPINQPLPVVFVTDGLRCTENEAILFWTVVESHGCDYYQVQKSQDQVEWLDVADGRIATKGVGRNRYAYILKEAAEYYRIKQVDVGGAILNSDAHHLTCNVAGQWAVWPNPAAADLHIKAPFGQAIVSLEVSDMLGQVIWRQDIGDADVTEYTIALNGKLSAAMYMLKVFPAKGSPIIKKFEVRR